MRIWIAAMVLMTASIALARPHRPTTRPSPELNATPATQPSAADEVRYGPTTAPADRATPAAQRSAPEKTSRPHASASNLKGSSAAPGADGNKFPTPAELMAKMKQADQARAQMPKVAYFDLTHPVAERPADFSLFGGDDSQTTLHTLISRLQKASDDKNIRGVLLTLEDSGLNLSQAQELRDALIQLRKAGKRTFVYADGYDTTGYTVASGATDICMLGGGEIMMPGVGLETMFAKGLLDKVGVEADYEQIGIYKGADEEFTRTQPSEELDGELKKLMNSMYDQIVQTISANRNLPVSTVKRLIDNALVTAKQAKDEGLVDHIVDQDGLRDLMSKELGSKVDLVTDYAEAPREQMDLSSPFALLALLNKRPAPPTRPGVALVYADGVIVDGHGGDSMFSTSSNIGGDDIREAMRVCDRDDKIDAVVLRINSPGGSALASEVMWQAVRRVAQHKPVIVSVGSMAASGGYYLASSGQYIFADPTAIVGSIGVVGGKFVTKDLFDKVGLSTKAYQKGANADLFSSSVPWSDSQRKLIRRWMQSTYDQFTDRVMTTRKGKIQNIEDVAQGRIFMAKQAKELGMVDDLGGVEDAIAYAAKQANLKPGAYDVRVVPAPRTLADIFGGMSGAESKLPFAPKVELSDTSILRLLPNSSRQLLEQQLTVMQLLEARPIALVSPYLVTVK